MTTTRQEDLSQRVLGALRSEASVELEPQLQARLRTRIELSAASLPLLDVVNGTESKISGANQFRRIAAALAAYPIATLSTTLALGGVLGASGHAAYSHRAAARVEQSQPAAAKPLSTASAMPRAMPPAPVMTIEDLPKVLPEVAGPGEHAVMPARSAHDPPRQPQPPSDPAEQTNTAGLAEQLSLLETARGAFSHGDAARALQALQAHAQQFPHCALSEEREALLIKSLLLAGRRSDAETRLLQFQENFPSSLLLPNLRQSIGKIP